MIEDELHNTSNLEISVAIAEIAQYIIAPIKGKKLVSQPVIALISS